MARLSYHPLVKILHWISALTIILLFSVGYWMVDLSYYSEWYNILPHWHKSVGLILFMLTLLRLVAKIMSHTPKFEGAQWEKLGAKFAHSILYILLFITFISGYMLSTADGRGIDIFNWFTLPGLGEIIENQEDIAGEVHFLVTYSLIILSLLHALVALKHHFLNKDNTLKKML